MEPFVLLDDALAGSATLLTALQSVDLVGLDSIDSSLRAGWSRGWHCFARLPYTGNAALFWFAHRFAVDPDAFLPSTPAGLIDAAHDVTADEFAAGIQTVKEAIAAGTCYQVNYTHRVHATVSGDPRALYRRLRERQPVAFGVLAHLPEPAAAWTLSLSPELFLDVRDGLATSRPMKGTAPIESDPSALRDDPKNRAENLMIVDLLRNDLSQVADDVSVPALFEVEAVGRLWQMTSTVTGRLRPDVGLGDLLRATFPCGSITGAPKLASMRIIDGVERDERGLYTGSLGVIEDGRATLNIAIRTLEIDEAGRARLGIGSGVVADSTAESEWQECIAKAAFATGLTPDVHLREAIRVVDGVAPLAELHRRRLSRSSAALGIPLRTDPVADAIAQTPPGAWRVGIDVAPDGASAVTHAPLTPTVEPVDVVIAPAAWSPTPWSIHKTTDRAHFDDATAFATRHGAFDAIGHTVDGVVLEGARTSVFARIDERWVTPPLDLGILDSVQRRAILDDPALIGADSIEEAAFTVDDLRRAESVIVANAVRGPLTARLKEIPSP
ncbi:MAG TPA: chorismate-binding protein [Tessaracoccus flavescens]|uniref:Chorismate-binding protein n=1 Tax=Tessaracoccus flavescens TaxID=399497 RepID=A0A921JPM8_9ACTN|nr:chorismate-binding protein [Tessaracoccus flavescens]